MSIETTVSRNSGTGLQGNHACMSEGDGGCWWQGELSHYTVSIRETHGDDWPLQLYRACVSTWSLVVKAVVWVGPYCWLIGSDLGKPAQTRHPASEGSMSLPEYCRSTCRDGWWLEAESQTGAPPPPPNALSLPPSPNLSVSFSSLAPSLSHSAFPKPLPSPPLSPFTPTLSLHPLAPSHLASPSLLPSHCPISHSHCPGCPWPREGVLLCGLLERRNQNTE